MPTKNPELLKLKKARYRKKHPEGYRRRGRNWARKNPDKTRNWKLQRKFGITLEMFNEMNERQGGKCKICKKPCETYRNLTVDHNHRTGRIRGLLCSRHNKALGLFRDNIQELLDSVDYLLEDVYNEQCNENPRFCAFGTDKQ